MYYRGQVLGIKGYWEYLKTYGAIKVVFALLTFVTMCGFGFFILGSYLHIFWNSLAVACSAYFPFIPACEDLSDVGVTIVQASITLFGSLVFSVNLLKRSIVEMVIVFILICIVSMVGYFDFKKRYANNN